MSSVRYNYWKNHGLRTQDFGLIQKCSRFNPSCVMKKYLVLSCSILLVLAGLLSACDNNNDEGVSEEALQDFTSMMSNAFSVFSLLSLELAPESTSQKQPSPADLFDCPNGGQVDFNVTNIGGADDIISYAMDFNNCNGLNGALQYAIGGEFTDNNIEFDITVDGSITAECSVTFTQFNEKIGLTEPGTPSAGITFTLNGLISSTCNNEAFSCVFENDSFDTSNTSFFENRCSAG